MTAARAGLAGPAAPSSRVPGRVSATMFTLPIQGHVAVALPLVRELTDRGVAVEVHTSAAFRERFQAVGATVVEYPPAQFAAIEAPSANFLAVAALLGRLTRTALLDDAVAALHVRRPDVVIVDQMAPWGLHAARRLELPVVTSTVSFVVHGGLGASPRAALDIARRLPTGVAALASMARTRAMLRRTVGVDVGGPIRLLSNRGDATLVYTSRAMQPGAARLGPDVEYVGAATVGPAAAGQYSANPGDQRAGDALLAALPGERLIYVALGTLYNDRPAFYRACIAAFAGLGRPLVIAAGRRTDLAAIGRLPPDVFVVPFAPQVALLERADLFITHGGMNSVNEALLQGVPMVVFPQAADQPVVAARVEQLGAGIVLRGRNPGAAAIRKAAARVLAGGAAARRAAEIGDGLRESGGAAAAADVVLAHARVETVAVAA
jgi:MGT family glycosyltransferase